MRVDEHVRKSIDDWQLYELNSAMMHACAAVDGTASKALPSLSSEPNKKFTTFLRDNFSILGPMSLPGVNLEETRFPVKVANPKAMGGKPDIADIIYGVHRCCHAHGEELPDGFELFHDAAGLAGVTRMEGANGSVRLSDRVIFGLLAIVVVSLENNDQSLDESYFLKFAEKKFTINKWWGRREEFIVELGPQNGQLATLNFSDWMVDK